MLRAFEGGRLGELGFGALAAAGEHVDNSLLTGRKPILTCELVTIVPCRRSAAQALGDALDGARPRRNSLARAAEVCAPFYSFPLILPRREQVRAALVAWAAEANFTTGTGTPAFFTEKDITAQLNGWARDALDGGSVVLPIKQSDVKREVRALYKEQLHRGDRNGLLKGLSGKTNRARTWNFSDVFFTSTVADADGERFEREILKRMFALLDTDGDRDAAAAAAAMTPAQRAGLQQPQSVVPIVYALAGACSAAPDFATLTTTARNVVLATLQELEERENGSASAASGGPQSPVVGPLFFFACAPVARTRTHPLVLHPRHSLSARTAPPPPCVSLTSIPSPPCLRAHSSCPHPTRPTRSDTT